MTKEELPKFKKDLSTLLEKYNVFLAVNMEEDSFQAEFVVSGNDGSEHILNPHEPHLELSDLK